MIILTFFVFIDELVMAFLKLGVIIRWKVWCHLWWHKWTMHGYWWWGNRRIAVYWFVIAEMNLKGRLAGWNRDAASFWRRVHFALFCNTKKDNWDAEIESIANLYEKLENLSKVKVASSRSVCKAILAHLSSHVDIKYKVY